MLLTHKTECYPTKEQASFIEQMFGVRRFIFNKFLTTCKETFGVNLKANKRLISKKYISDLRKNLLRTTYKHIVGTVPSQIVETTMEDFNRALDSLWKDGKEIKLRKKKLSNTCRIARKTDNNFKYEKDSKYLSIVRLGLLKLAEPLRYKFNDNIKCITIKKIGNRYFISITMDVKKPLDKRKLTGRVVALDWGIRKFFVGWNGEKAFKFNLNDDILDKLNENIKRKEKALYAKKKNSKNSDKAKAKLNQAYFKKECYIEDKLKKFANHLSKKYDVILLENLKMKFVTQGANPTNRRTCKDKPFYKAKVIFYNKFSQYKGKILYEVNKNNTSKRCYKCGYIHKDLNGDEMFICPHCGYKKDRDVNAAMNIFVAKERVEIVLR